MKIKCSLDIGAWWDILCIYNVKLNNAEDPRKIQQNKENFKNLAKEIKEQIGESLYYQIITSNEYKELYDANNLVFYLVDKAEKSEGLAREVADGNRQRFEAKSILQKKFFGNGLSEIKI